MKLKQKLILIFLLLSALPILTISIFTYYRYTYLINLQMDQIADNMVGNAVDDINDTILNMQKMTDLLCFDSVTNELHKYNNITDIYKPYDVMTSNNNIKVICQNIIYSYNYVNGVFLFTPRGPVLGYGYGNGIDIRDDYVPFEDEWYQNTLYNKGRIYVGSPSTKAFMIRNRGESISFSKAIYDVYTREFLGVLFIDCSPEIFSLSNVNTLPHTALFTVRQGDIIYYTDANEETISMNPSTSLKYQRDLDLDGLILTADFNYENLYREFDDTAHILILFVLLSSVVFIFIALTLAGSLAEPITYLSNKMADKEGSNRLSDEKWLNRTDEVGVLYNEYQRYTEELDRYITNELQNKLITLDSQMKSLEAQINSHFLYNTLESINSIAEIEEIESIVIMSQALGDMFRYSIKTQSELVTIEDELKHVRDYYAIQSIRFDNRFKLQIQMEEHLKELKVLKLILQPIVENALYHGLQRCSIGGCIIIACTVEQSIIRLSVSDDGVGMSGERLAKLQAMLKEKPQFAELGQRNKQSIGIKNIDTRIKLYYGENYGLTVSSAPGEGTCITIRIPLMQ